MDQLAQILGAIAILVAFILAQAGRLDDRSVPYLVLNLTGSATLAILALLGAQWGFFLLEGTWAVVSAVSLARLTLRRGRAV
ncbi:MAG: hypothetical protein E6I45_13140 [Chloroflexi bacterium]|nr:MAG: hypothetical protein E6I45_13140 [Chloroflexota bacterium]